MDLEQLAAALAAESAAQSLPLEWRRSGSGFGFIVRPIIGVTLVEFDYDYPAKRGDAPRWVAVIWRSAMAFDFNAVSGPLAVLYCEAPSPSGLDADSLARLAAFAVGAARLAPVVETVTEGKAGKVEPE